MAPQVGFEPTTLRLTAECSTVELLRNTGWASPITPSWRLTVKLALHFLNALPKRLYFCNCGNAVAGTTIVNATQVAQGPGAADCAG